MSTFAANPAAARAAAGRPWQVRVFVAGVESHFSAHRTRAAADAALVRACPAAAGHEFWFSAASLGADGQTRAWLTRAGVI